MEGKEVFNDYRVYMPQATTSRNEEMVFGASLKAGLIRDTSIQPFKPKVIVHREDVTRGG